MVFAELAPAHNATVHSFRQAFAVQLEAFGLLAGAHVINLMGQVGPKREAVWTALRRTREGREEAIAVVVQAFPCYKAHAVVNLWSHHVCFYLGVLFLRLA